MELKITIPDWIAITFLVIWSANLIANVWYRVLKYRIKKRKQL